MWFVIGSLGLVGALIVWAAVIDFKARRRKMKYSIDPASVRDHRRITDARFSNYDGAGGGF